MLKGVCGTKNATESLSCLLCLSHSLAQSLYPSDMQKHTDTQVPQKQHIFTNFIGSYTIGR